MTTRTRRSCLAVPGSSQKFIDKARSLPVDQVFLDLEDACAPLAKPGARKTIVEALNEGGWGERLRVVRVNDWTTEWTYRDVTEVVEGAGAHLDAIMLPKVQTPEQIVALDLPPDDSPAALEPVKSALHEIPGVTALLAGGPAFYGDIQELSENDLRRSEFISLPLAALALLLVFGSLVAAGLPIAAGGTAVIIALGVIFAVAQVTPLSIFVLNLATLLGLGLGVDYSLLMTSRFREELARREGPDRVAEAVEAYRTAVELSANPAERAYLAGRLAELSAARG